MTGKILNLHKKLINKEFSAQELSQKYLDYIDLHNETLNAYIHISRELAITSAKETDKKIASGEPIHILSGIPMTLKDNICTKDVLTSCGSKMLSGYRPVYSAFAYNQLSERGCVLLGKTNMDEFAMGSTCETSFYGSCKNPFDITRVPGGSSGGGSCAVSSDMAVFALGSDTGGSVRQPAGFCGVVGLKPTYGAVSRNGLVAFASAFDQIGVMASSVEDTAIVFDAISAYDPSDSTCAKYIRQNTYEALKKDIKGLKIGVIKNLFENISPDIKNAINTAIESFENIGVSISEVDIDNLDLALSAYYILTCAQASSNLARYDGVRFGYRASSFADINDMIVKTRTEAFGTEVKRRIMLGNFVLSSGYYKDYYAKAEAVRLKLADNLKKAFEKYDILLCPTCSQTAFKLNSFSNSPVDMYRSDLCTTFANMAGLPAISVPCGFDKNNLPIGLQLIGDKFTEALLLNVAYKYEEENHKIMYQKPVVGGLCIEL